MNDHAIECQQAAMGGDPQEFGKYERSPGDPMGMRPPLTKADAKAALIDAAGNVGDNAASLDKAADALLERTAAFFGECVGGDTFCGLSVDEVRDGNGLLLSIRFVACDLVSGEPVRRVGR